MLSQSLKDALLACSLAVLVRMDELLPKDFKDSKLIEAMRYSSLSDGKRIRPFLVIASGHMFGVDINRLLNAAVAVELVHTYSLIHDDLPAMDNDDFRRGNPTCHKKFDEATAILAGDALLTLAFEILTDEETHGDAAVRCELIKILSKAAGYKGMVGGQMIDLEKANKEISKEELAALHRLKTGELFMASAEFGAVVGRAGLNERKALRYYANDLGLAFQIKDDILDHLGNKSEKIEIDEIEHKKIKDNASVVDVIGIENAQEQLKLLSAQASAHLKIFGKKANLLKDLAEFLVNREK
jgi:farnesyl diphosphate synthase